MATIAELFQRAVHLHQSGNLAQAEPLYRQILQIDPVNADAHNFLGVVAYQSGRPQAALALIRQAIVLNPKDANAHNNLGNVLKEQGQFAEAMACYRQALQINPNNANAHYNLGNLLKDQEQPAEAALCYQQALRINPHQANAHNNLGTAFKDQGLPLEAIACFREALRLNSKDANVHCNLGNALVLLGKLAEADECYRQALAIDSVHKPTLWNRGVMSLLQGDFERGWQHFDLRWALPGVVPPTFQQPRWDGTPLEGKTILVYAEMGLGDTIHFLRFLPMVQERGGKVLFFECQPPLFELLSGIKGVDQLIAAGTPLPPFDVQIPLLSLPGIFRTTLATIPVDIPYLAADPKLIEHWRKELDGGGRRVASGEEMRSLTPLATRHSPLKVGIAWQADPKHKKFSFKSFPLKWFEALARVENVQLVSLQVGPGTDQLAAATFPVLDLGNRFDPNSLSDLAAAMMSLDLVVTVDTAVGHLAGALGLPVWVVLPIVWCWRWLLDRDDSPWYPTMRLFRQRRLGDWAEVFDRIAAEVRKRSQESGVRRTKTSDS